MSEEMLPQLPQSPDAERSVLGAMMQDEGALIQAAESLLEEVLQRMFVTVHPILRGLL